MIVVDAVCVASEPLPGQPSHRGTPGKAIFKAPTEKSLDFIAEPSFSAVEIPPHLDILIEANEIRVKKNNGFENGNICKGEERREMKRDFENL